MRSDLIRFRTEATEELIELLDTVEYGTNGAIYRHLDTRERISAIDNPLFLTLEHRSKVLANVAFCRRSEGWYIRFFGFAKGFRASSSNKRAASNSLLRKELKAVFDQLLQSEESELSAPLLYAYIDPNNDRSKLISRDFGFLAYTGLITQTFSRVYPKRSPNLVRVDDYETLRKTLNARYAKHLFFQDHHISKGPFYGLRDKSGELNAFAHVTPVHWELKRLPGKFGKQLVHIIPYIPFLNRLLKPKAHTFLAVDAVWTSDQNSQLLSELFASILAEHKLNLLIWWTDERDPYSSRVYSKVRWGLLDKMVGRTRVDVMVRTAQGHPLQSEQPVFVSAFDMV